MEDLICLLATVRTLKGKRRKDKCGVHWMANQSNAKPKYYTKEVKWVKDGKFKALVVNF